MTTKINLEDVEAWKGGGLLPAGTHHVEIAEVTEKTSSNGNPQAEVELRAIGGDYDGGTIRDWITLIPAAFGRVKQFLEAVKYDIPPGDFEMPTDELRGRQCRIVVREELYQGEAKNKVKAYEAVADTDMTPATAGNGHKSGDLPF